MAYCHHIDKITKKRKTLTFSHFREVDMITDETAERDVKLAAEALDLHAENAGGICKGWREIIDLKSFAIRDSERCVLGQTFGKYDKTPEYLLNYPAFGNYLRLSNTFVSHRDAFRTYEKAWRKYLTA